MYSSLPVNRIKHTNALCKQNDLLNNDFFLGWAELWLVFLGWNETFYILKVPT